MKKIMYLGVYPWIIRTLTLSAPTMMPTLLWSGPAGEYNPFEFVLTTYMVDKYIRPGHCLYLLHWGVKIFTDSKHFYKRYNQSNWKWGERAKNTSTNCNDNVLGVVLQKEYDRDVSHHHYDIRKCSEHTYCCEFPCSTVHLQCLLKRINTWKHQNAVQVLPFKMYWKCHPDKWKLPKKEYRKPVCPWPFQYIFF